MKKLVNCIITLSICIIVGITVCFALSACHGKEVNRFPVDKRFIPAHTQTWTTYTTIKVGKSVVPIAHHHSRWVEDDWQIGYKVIYEDDSSEVVWESVSKEEYDGLYLDVDLEEE